MPRSKVLILVLILFAVACQIGFAQVIPGIAAGNSRSVTASGSVTPDASFTWQVKTSTSVVLASNQANNGWTVNYDPITDELSITVPISASPRSNVTVTYLNGTSGESAQINILAGSVIIGDASPKPGWAQEIEPVESVGTAGGTQGPSAPVRISMVSGVVELGHEPDLMVSNPRGPNPEFKRYYRSTRAMQNVSGPGLPPGWFDGYYFEIVPVTGSGWRTLVLTSPNGATEQFSPLLDQNQVPTGEFTRLKGAPYQLVGTPSSTVPGRWDLLELRTNQQERHVFSRRTDSSYLLSHIYDKAGQSITINRSSSRALSSIVSGTGQTLMQFAFDGQPYLRRVLDLVSSRRVLVTSASEFGSDVLKTVSIVHSPSVSSPQTRWQYNYTSVLGRPVVSAVGAPDASSPNNLAFNAISYEPQNGRAVQMDDANGNYQTYRYGQGGTVVRKGTGASTAIEYTALFDSNGRSSGKRNALGVADSISYADPLNPNRPTQHANRLGQVKTAEYDLSGNITKQTDSRGVATTFVYDNTSSPFGLVASVRTAGLTETSYVRDSRGFISEVFTPVPGQTSGTQRSTIYERNSLGDITRLQNINSVGGLSTTTFEYLVDTDADLGDITLTEPGYGRPLRVTDPLGRVIKFRYDTLGNVVREKDANGQITDYQYNLGGQLVRITHPPKVAGAGRAWTSYVYDTVGGALKTVVKFDELGIQSYLQTTLNSREADPRGVSGNIESTSTVRDAIGRATRLLDGNNQAVNVGYNSIGTLQRLTRPLGQQNTVSTNSEGEPTGLTNARGESITITRAADDSRMTGVTYTASPSLNSSLVHDIYGRVTRITDQAGVRDLTYDHLGNILSETTTFVGLPGSFAVSYSYTPDNRIAAMTSPKGTHVYEYDAVGNLVVATAPWTGGRVEYRYNNKNLLTRETNQDLVTLISRNFRDEIIQVQNLFTLAPTETVSRYSQIKYNGNGLPISATITQPRLSSTAPSRSGRVEWFYDDRSNLVREKRVLTNDSGAITGVLYDTDPNNSSQFDAANNPTNLFERTLPFNSNSEVATAGFATDAQGNPTNYDGRELTFNSADQWVQSPNGYSRLSFEDGLLARKLTITGKETFYLYDQSGNVVVEIAGANSQPGPGHIYAAYSHGPWGVASRFDGSSQSYSSFVFDIFGNVTTRYRQGDSWLAASEVYDAYGRVFERFNVNAAGPLAVNDPIGPLSQFGGRSEEEDRAAAGGRFVVTKGGNIYDPATGRMLHSKTAVKSVGELPGFIAGRLGSALERDSDKILDGVQLGLDLAGLVPGLGEPFDLANAGISFARGDNVSGGLSLAATIPGAGIGATGAKWAIGSGLPLVGLMAKNSDEAAGVVQYTLRADKDGLYPVMAWGRKDPVDMVFLQEGDVWKIGQTKSPMTRYDNDWLTNQNLRFEREKSGSRVAMLRREFRKLKVYHGRMGHLPPGNKIFR